MADEDDDVYLQRASSAMIAKVLHELPKLVRKPTSIRLTSVLNQLEPFQGDPQLLDAHLKSLLPVIIAAYTKQVEEPSVSKEEVPSTSAALSKIIYTLCKIRGESPIVGFLSNEPRHLDPLVNYFERNDNDSLAWEERYVILLWLSHLTLTPFDLSSISTEPVESLSVQGPALSRSTPPIVVRILRIAFKHLFASSRELKAAARLLARLCIRSDMKRISLADTLIQWALKFLSTGSNEGTPDLTTTTSAHKRTCILVFLGYIVATSSKDISTFVPQIYSACQKELNDSLEMPSFSTAKRALVKLLRDVALLCLSPDADIPADTSAIIEEVIGQLLESLSDKETPIRTTASKALSMITTRLPPEMAEEVVQSIIDSFNIDVFRTADSSRADLSQVNPGQWHGLTLTLGQLLFRRMPPISQLSEILKTLLRSLNFEQRSPTGISIGTNVRDAANFGIWSLSRRYIPKELTSVEASTIQETWENETTSQTSTHGSDRPPCVQQLLAAELLISACLDPNGNIRRGSSAALQELVGRHPNTISEGISLVQVVDYHAVGLRERAMVEVSAAAAAFGDPSIYLLPLFHHLLGWRGVGSGDAASRAFAAKAIGRLSRIHAHGLFEAVINSFALIKQRDVERRHGLLLCLAALLDTKSQDYINLDHIQDEQAHTKMMHSDLQSLTLKTWAVFSDPMVLRLQDSDFTSHSLRPELTTVAVAKLISSLARASAALNQDVKGQTKLDSALQLVPLCLTRFDDAVLATASYLARGLILMSSDDERFQFARSWLDEERKGNLRTALRQSGYVLALGAAFPHLEGHAEMQHDIIHMLCARCGESVEIESRVIALKGIAWVVTGKGQPSKGSWRTGEPTPSLPTGELGRKIVEAILMGLKDYTVNERGDVGSLVRIQALESLEALPRDFESNPGYKDLHEDICAASRRLSVEKLDKVRLKASQVFTAVPRRSFTSTNLHSVSSYDHFRSVLHDSFWGPSPKVTASVFEGLVVSAGGGASETIVQNVRAALIDVLDEKLTDGKASSQATVLAVCNIFVDVLRQNLENERVLTPLLDTLGFLFDVGIFQKLHRTDFKWRTLLSLIQKSHYKTGNIAKIFAAITCYRGLAEIDTTRADVLKKLRSMQKHPFPKVREAAVEALHVVTRDDGLRAFTASM